MEEIIKLRGHHLSALAENFWWRIFPKEYKFPNKKEDKLMIASNFSYHNNKGLLERERFISFQLIKNPKIKIEIVNGLDSICLPDCSNMCDICSSIEAINEDAFNLKEYDLKHGEIYEGKIIMERIKKYPKKDQYKWVTPRDKYRTFLREERRKELFSF